MSQQRKTLQGARPGRHTALRGGHTPGLARLQDLALGRPLLDFPGSSDEKESAHNAGDLCSVPGWGRSPGGRHGNTQVFLPRGSRGQRSLAGYSPWDCKELDTTEKLSLSLLRLPSWYITNPECPTSRPGHFIGTHTALLLKYLPPQSLPEQCL